MDSVWKHSYIEMLPNNLNMSDNILLTILGQKHLPLVNDKLISRTHRKSISHFKPSYTEHVANIWVYNINNSENFIIFPSGFLYFLHFKNLFWHTESYLVAESNKLLNLFFFTLIPWLWEEKLEKSNWNCHQFYWRAKPPVFLMSNNGLHESVFLINFGLQRKNSHEYLRKYWSQNWAKLYTHP